MVRNCSSHRSGQISIDYMAGAMVFFGAVVVLVSTVIGAVPQVQETRNVNDLQMVGMSISEVIMQDSGYWANQSANGTDWHRDERRPFTVTLGLQTADRDGIHPEKVNALHDMEYDRITQILGIERDFSVQFTEFLYIHTRDTFTAGDAPDYITEPDYPDQTASRIHYGAEDVDGTPHYFLVSDNRGWYNNLWISTDWDFEDAEHYDIAQNQLITMNQDSYIINLGDTQLSDGDMLVMRQDLGRAGAVPPDHVEDIVEINRFAVTADEQNVIRGVFQVW